MKRIIIGGVPAPIGGVTTFLRRLLHRDSEHIKAFVDFYPDNKEPLRADCQAKLIQVAGRFGLMLWLWLSRRDQIEHELFFNFSQPHALLMFLMIPKWPGTRWNLMLHHGSLHGGPWFQNVVTRILLTRFDKILCLSESQSEFYRHMHIPARKILPASSYCQPADHIDSPSALIELNVIKSQFSTVAVMSGFPRELYNFDIAIEAFAQSGRSDTALCIFIYGSGDRREHLINCAEKYEWLFVFDGRIEQDFNTFLHNSDLLLRLTKVDSLGIAVWDADHWDVPIIASDVCKRPDRATVLQIEDTALQRNLAAAIHEQLR